MMNVKVWGEGKGEKGGREAGKSTHQESSNFHLNIIPTVILYHYTPAKFQLVL